MKDKNLKVIYHRGEGGELHVFLYRSNYHIATIQVEAQNGIDVYRGINNRSKIKLHESPTAQIPGFKLHRPSKESQDV